MDTLSVSQTQLDSTMAALQRGDYKTALIWGAVIVAGLAVALLARRFGFTVKKGE